MRSDRGEPYDTRDAQALVTKLVHFHSALGVPHPHPPPLVAAAGFTDDIFGVDETLRFARLARGPVSLLFGDVGHQRAANKTADRRRLQRSLHAWFDHYVRGDLGRAPRSGVVALTQTCPRTRPSEGPFHARTFARLARRLVRFASLLARSFTSAGASVQVGAAIDPVAGGGDGCATTSAADQARSPSSACASRGADPSGSEPTLAGPPCRPSSSTPSTRPLPTSPRRSRGWPRA
jgi:hypothetical protein